MMYRFLVQTVLSLGLLQAFPADAGVVERHASLPTAPDRVAVASPGVYEAQALLARPLPQAADVGPGPVKVDRTSVGVETSAVAAIVVDRSTGKVLFEKNGDTPRSIGSISKLMATMVYLQGKPDLDADAAIEAEDVRQGGVQHLAVGDTVKVRDLLEAALIGSDNTAVYALVRLSGLSIGDFVARMNETAAEMGLRATTFIDPAGLSPDNRSIAPDLATMVDHALKQETIRTITAMPEAKITGASGRTYTVESTNELLTSFMNQPPYKIVGGKTGYLPEAGYCFGAVFSEKDGHELTVVVLGSDSKQGRFQDAKALAAWAYKVFDWPDERRT